MTETSYRPLKHYLNILDKMEDLRVGIVGDLILDRYIYGRPTRLSREAPLPIIEYETEREVCGGMANTAMALNAIGVKPVLFGVVGDDEDGRILQNLLTESGINEQNLLQIDTYRTITKTRIMAGGLHTAKYQVARIDRGEPISNRHSLLERVAVAVENCQDVAAWVISDYGYGLVGNAVERVVKEKAAEGAIVVGDSRYRIHEFSHITAITPNEEETLEFGKCILNFETDIDRIGEAMLEILQLKAVLITQGNRGMRLFRTDSEPIQIPVVGTTDIVDVSGAGDVVVAAFTAALAAGADFLTSAQLANIAASIVVMKRGTAVAYSEEIKAKLREVISDG